MALARVHTWSAGEVLLASDLNAEFNNVLTNANSLISPFTTNVSGGGFQLNNIVLGASTPLAGSFTTIAATSIALGGGSAFSTYVSPTTFTPTVTLVGGAGNTVPVYSTNSGRYERIGNHVFVDILLTGDGGAEGAGTGQITIALPIACNASFPASSFVIGRSSNGGNSLILFGSIASTSLTVAYQQTISAAAALTGDDQNNTSRTIRMQFHYEA